MRWGRVLERQRQRIPYCIQSFPPLNIIPEYPKAGKPITDFGKLVESVDRYKPNLIKEYIVLIKKRPPLETGV